MAPGACPGACWGLSVANISVCWLSLLQTSRILHAEYLFLLQPSRWSAARFKNPAAEFSVSATHKPCACCRKGTFYSRKKKNLLQKYRFSERAKTANPAFCRFLRQTVSIPLCSPSPASPAFPPPLHPAFLAVRGACRRPLPPPAPPLCRCSIMWSAAVRRAALVAARPGGWARPGAILYGTPAGGGVGGGLTRTRHPAGVTTVVAGGRRFQLAMTQDVAPRTSLTAHGVGFFVVGCGEGRRRQPPRGLSGASGGGVTCWFFV